MEPLDIDGQQLTFADVESVARERRAVQLGEHSRKGVLAARKTIEDHLATDEITYGVNTGFGSLSRVRIGEDDLRDLQRNLIRSHAAGVGEVLGDDIVRAMLLALAASLSRGYSGVRVELIERILDLLNSGVTPVVPSRGSVGASGDLAPLAHASLVLIGEGEARFRGEVLAGDKALQKAGLSPVTLEAKEGLALINGTHLMTAIAVLTLVDLDRLIDAAICSAAMAIDACRATDAFLDSHIHDVRNQPGQRAVAQQLRDLLAGSQILSEHKVNDPRVQDPYSLRTTPQVLGAVIDCIGYVAGVIERECGAVTDNPLVFADSGEIISGGNFHGMPLAIALDSLTIAVSHLAGIAERRIYWLLAASDCENPVNAFLSPQPGVHSGLMLVQYTAAACCNEIQTLASPASVANIPTSAGIEDYNSMGATAAHQARRAVDLATQVIAIELLVTAEAMEYQRPLQSGNGVESVHRTVREAIPRLSEDRPPSPDIAAVAELIRRGGFTESQSQAAAV